MNLITVIVIFFIECFTQGFEIAKEVEGGVQLMDTGQIELILPERLSFTVKRLHPSQECKGDFVICYEVTATKRLLNGKKKYYVNYRPVCPSGTCLLMIHPRSVYGLTMDESDYQIYAFFNDDSVLACPRKVLNNRASFTVSELPDCPVFVNGAKIPKDEKEVSKGASTVKWIIIICVVVALLIVIIVVGFCIFIRCRDKPAVEKFDHGEQRVSKSVISPITHNKRSPINTPVET